LKPHPAGTLEAQDAGQRLSRPVGLGEIRSHRRHIPEMRRDCCKIGVLRCDGRRDRQGNGEREVSGDSCHHLVPWRIQPLSVVHIV
jgi:hypothetical protein